MVEVQIEVKSVAFSNGVLQLKSTQCRISLSKDNKFGQNVLCAVGEECNISCFTKTIYFVFYWRFTSNKWPITPKLELVCSMDKHNIPPQNIPKYWYFSDDRIYSTID